MSAIRFQFQNLFFLKTYNFLGFGSEASNVPSLLFDGETTPSSSESISADNVTLAVCCDFTILDSRGGGAGGGGELLFPTGAPIRVSSSAKMSKSSARLPLAPAAAPFSAGAECFLLPGASAGPPPPTICSGGG